MVIKDPMLFWLGILFIAVALLMFYSIWRYPQWVVNESRWMPWFIGGIGLLSFVFSFLIAG